MFLGHIRNIEQDRKILPLSIQKGLEYLIANDFRENAPGRYVIQGTKMYASISEYTTEPKEDRRAESHKQYIDIQYVASGEEVVYFSVLSDQSIVVEDKPEQDVMFYSTVDEEVAVKLSEGMYAVFFPWDIHRPNCQVFNPQQVKKVVVKVSHDLI